MRDWVRSGGMTLGTRLTAGLRALIAPTLFLGLAGFFGWSATQGERGLQTNAVRQAQLGTARAELKRVEGERDAMERRVAALRQQRLDPDMLDERARAMTGWTEPSDVVVLFVVPNRLF